MILDSSHPPTSRRTRKNPTTPIHPTPELQPPGWIGFYSIVVDELPLYGDVTVVEYGVSSRREDKFSGKQVISFGSDSEDSTRPRTSNKYEPMPVDSLEQHWELESGSSDADSGEANGDLNTRISKPSISCDASTNWMQGASFRSSFPNDAIEVNSDQEEEVISTDKRGRKKQTRSS